MEVEEEDVEDPEDGRSAWGGPAHKEQKKKRSQEVEAKAAAQARNLSALCFKAASAPGAPWPWLLPRWRSCGSSLQRTTTIQGPGPLALVPFPAENRT